MSAGYQEDPDALAPFDENAPGLAGLDVPAAADNLANVGSDVRARMAGELPPVDAVSGGAAPDETFSLLPDQPGNLPPGAAPAAPGAAPGAPGAPAAPAGAPGGVDVYNLGDPHAPAPPANPLAPPTFDELGPLPPRPTPTGDPAKDIAALTTWTQALDARHVELERRKTALAGFAAQVGAQKGKKDAEVAGVEEKRKREEAQRYVVEQQRRQAVIDDAVAMRMNAYKDLEGAKWDKPHTGGEIVALIMSSVGAALQNAGAAQLGQVGHAENEAQKAIDAKMDREYAAKKLKLEAAGDAVLAAQYGYKTAGENHRAAMNALDAEMAAKYKLIAKETEDQLLQAGAPKAAVDGDMLVTENLQKSAAHEEQIHDREQQRQNGAANAKAMQDIARANLGQRGTEHTENMDEKRTEFALRRQDSADARAERLAAEKAKRDEKASDSDKLLEIHNGDGSFAGYANSPRVVKPIQDRIVQYDDAVESLEALKAYRKEHNIVGALPTGDRYDRAVLAVGATTQANASDKSTMHEANTLKDFGLVNDDAIDRTLEHVRQRQAKFLRQLRHEPRGKGAAPVSDEGSDGEGFDAPGGTRYELGKDGNYHKVK